MIILVYPFYSKSVHNIGYYPVGLGYIAEQLLQNKIEYEVVDLTYHSQNFLHQKIKYFHPEFIGISLMSGRCREHYKLLSEIKQKFPYLKIIAGGPHISAFGEEVLSECNAIDYGITFEGEETIIELLKSKGIEKIKGLIYKDGDEIKYNGIRKFIDNLDSVPFPTFAKFELNKYSERIDICSSRGCPFKCIYCAFANSPDKKWRGKSAEYLLSEIEYWYERGFRFFNFVDSNFAFDKKRVMDFCEEIQKRNLKLKFSSDGVRCDCVDKEMLKKMWEVGFCHLQFGVESGNDEILRNLKKGMTKEIIERCIKDACEIGYEVSLFFLIGSPGETQKTVNDSFNLALKYPITEVFFFKLIPFPKTEFYDWVLKNNLLRGKLDNNYLNVGIDGDPIHFLPTLSIRQMKKLYKKGLKIRNKIKKRFLFKRYCETFTKLVKINIIAYIIAFILSRDIITKIDEKLQLSQKIKRKLQFWNNAEEFQ